MDLSCGPAHSPWEDPGDTLFSTTVGNKVGRGTSLSLKSPVVALLCKSEITVRTLALNWKPKYNGKLNIREAEGKSQHLITKVKVSMVTVRDSRVNVAIRRIRPTETLGCLVYHGTLEAEETGNLLNSNFICIMEEF